MLTKYVIFRIDNDHPLGYSNFTEYDTREEALDIVADQLIRNTNMKIMYLINEAEDAFEHGRLYFKNDEGKIDWEYGWFYTSWIQSSDPMLFMNVVDNFKMFMKREYEFYVSKAEGGELNK